MANLPVAATNGSLSYRFPVYNENLFYPRNSVVMYNVENARTSESITDSDLALINQLTSNGTLPSFFIFLASVDIQPNSTEPFLNTDWTPIPGMINALSGVVYGVADAVENPDSDSATIATGLRRGNSITVRRLISRDGSVEFTQDSDYIDLTVTVSASQADTATALPNIFTDSSPSASDLAAREAINEFVFVDTLGSQDDPATRDSDLLDGLAVAIEEIISSSDLVQQPDFVAAFQTALNFLETDNNSNQTIIGPVTFSNSGNAITVSNGRIVLQDGTQLRTNEITNATDVLNGTVSLSQNRLTNVDDPTAAQDAATKNYVDTIQTDLINRINTDSDETALLARRLDNKDSDLDARIDTLEFQVEVIEDALDSDNTIFRQIGELLESSTKAADDIDSESARISRIASTFDSDLAIFDIIDSLLFRVGKHDSDLDSDTIILSSLRRDLDGVRDDLDSDGDDLRSVIRQSNSNTESISALEDADSDLDVRLDSDSAKIQDLQEQINTLSGGSGASLSEILNRLDQDSDRLTLLDSDTTDLRPRVNELEAFVDSDSPLFLNRISVLENYRTTSTQKDSEHDSDIPALYRKIRLLGVSADSDSERLTNNLFTIYNRLNNDSDRIVDNDSDIDALRLDIDAIDQTFVRNQIDSDYINARVNLQDIVDSDEIQRIIDSDYINARVNLQDIVDSDEIQRIIDSEYINARVDLPPSTDSEAVINLIDSDYINARVIAGTDSEAIINLIDSEYIDARAYDSDVFTSRLTARGIATSAGIVILQNLVDSEAGRVDVLQRRIDSDEEVRTSLNVLIDRIDSDEEVRTNLNALTVRIDSDIPDFRTRINTNEANILVALGRPDSEWVSNTIVNSVLDSDYIQDQIDNALAAFDDSDFVMATAQYIVDSEIDNHVSPRIDTLVGRANTDSDRIATLTARVDSDNEVRTRVNALEVRADNDSDRIVDNDSDIDALRTDVGAIDQTFVRNQLDSDFIDGLAYDSDRFTNRLTARNIATAGGLSLLTARIDSDAEVRTRVNTATARLDSDIPNFRTRILALEEVIDSDEDLRQRVTGLISRVDSDDEVRTRVNDLSARVDSDDEVRTRVNDLIARVDSDDEVRTSLNVLIDRVDSDNEVRTRINDLIARVDSDDEVRTSLNVLTARVDSDDEIRTRVNDVTATVDSDIPDFRTRIITLESQPGTDSEAIINLIDSEYIDARAYDSDVFSQRITARGIATSAGISLLSSRVDDDSDRLATLTARVDSDDEVRTSLNVLTTRVDSDVDDFRPRINTLENNSVTGVNVFNDERAVVDHFARTEQEDGVSGRTPLEGNFYFTFNRTGGTPQPSSARFRISPQTYTAWGIRNDNSQIIRARSYFTQTSRNHRLAVEWTWNSGASFISGINSATPQFTSNAGGLGATETFLDSDHAVLTNFGSNVALNLNISRIELVVEEIGDSEFLVQGDTLRIRSGNGINTFVDSDTSTLTIALSDRALENIDSDVYVQYTRLDGLDSEVGRINDRVDTISSQGIDRDGLITILSGSKDSNENYIDASWTTSVFDSDTILINNRSVSNFPSVVSYTNNDTDSDTTSFVIGTEGSAIARISESGVSAATLVSTSAADDAAIITQIAVDEKGRVIGVHAATGIDGGEF